MIKYVRSDHESFKDIEFKHGLNIIIAERTLQSTDKDSRNGTGKTSLIEIIHFCLGGDIKKGDTLKSPDLDNWTFILGISLKGKDYSISRNTSDNKFVVIEGDFSDWPIAPIFKKEKNCFYMKIKDWTNILNYLVFDVPINISKETYSPSFRCLISYFIRKGKNGFIEPFSFFPGLKSYVKQISNTFLLGLNWEYAREFQQFKDNQKVLKDLKKALKQGLLTGVYGAKAELEAEKVREEDAIKNLENQLKTFKVHPQYYEIQIETDDITKEMHRLSNRIVLNNQILIKYNDSIEQENYQESIDQIKKIYNETGIYFSDNLQKTLDEVRTFHNTIIENRKGFLNAEINRILRKIVEDRSSIEKYSIKRAELMSVLETHGAYEEHSKLEKRLGSLQQNLKDIENRIENLIKFEKHSSYLKIRKEELLIKSRLDMDERHSIKERAISLFNNNSEALYKKHGDLLIDIADSGSGYTFDVDIPKAKSGGVSNMKIFCYDLTLIQLRKELNDMPGFIIHDSIIFDGVDERQISKALELAAKDSLENNYQYICTLNSDMVPYNDLSDGFKEQLDEYTVKILTDSKEDDGIFGIRF